MDQNVPSTHSCCNNFPQPHIFLQMQLDFDDKMMEGLHTCLYRMVLGVEVCNIINYEIERYWEGTGLFDFNDVIS